jgi:hypothetical protein
MIKQTYLERLQLTAVSRYGWFYFSKPEITQPEIYISLQQSGKLSPLLEATQRCMPF